MKTVFETEISEKNKAIKNKNFASLREVRKEIQSAFPEGSYIAFKDGTAVCEFQILHSRTGCLEFSDRIEVSLAPAFGIWHDDLCNFVVRNGYEIRPMPATLPRAEHPSFNNAMEESFAPLSWCDIDRISLLGYKLKISDLG